MLYDLCSSSYPSGRLAVLHLRPPSSTCLFFDDTDSKGNQLLGLVTRTGHVLVMQPACYARLVTDQQNERVYLCQGHTGLIDKQLQWSTTENNQIQFQLNAFLQLECRDSTNIRLSFTCQKEAFQFQLGMRSSRKESMLTDSAKAKPASIAEMKSIERKSTLSKKLAMTTSIKDTSIDKNKHVSQNESATDEQVNLSQIPSMSPLILLRKQIKQIFHNWLEHCRNCLGEQCTSLRMVTTTTTPFHSLMYSNGSLV